MYKRLCIALTGILCFVIADAVLGAELTGTLRKIKETGTIAIGHRETSIPFSYIGPDQKPIGYAIDLGLKIAEGVKDELKMDRIDVKFVPVNPQTRIPLLVNGTIDQECGSTTNTLGRQKQVDFTYTTFLTGTKIVVKKRSGIKEIEDLKGKPIAVNMGTTNEKAIKAVNEAKGLGLKIVHVKEHSEALVALETGRVDAYGTDDVVLYALIHKSKNPDQWEVVGRFLSYDPYGVMIRRNDADFRLVANKTLCGLFRSGEIYAIYDKWFKSINMPVSDRLRVVFETQAFPE